VSSESGSQVAEKGEEYSEASVHGISLQGSLGERLRAKRKQGELNLQDIAHHLKLDVVLLRAFEEDSGPPEGLPEVYYKGFLRNYARFLKVEIDPSAPQKFLSDQHPHTEPLLTAKRHTLLWPLLIVVALVAGWLITGGELSDYRLLQEGAEEALPSAAEVEGEERAGVAETTTPSLAAEPRIEEATEVKVTEEPVATESAERQGEEPVSVEESAEERLADDLGEDVENEDESEYVEESGVEGVLIAEPEGILADVPAVTRGMVTIRYIDDSWTQVVDGLGRVLVKRMLDAGAIETFEGTLPLEVNLGNAIGVRVQFNGEPFDHLNYIDDNNIAQFLLGGQE
jgi:cytoskeleton protein RodZ